MTQRVVEEIEAKHYAPVNYGRRVVRWHVGKLWFKSDLRVVGVCLILAAVGIAVFLFSLARGEYQISLPQLMQALTDSTESFTRTVVVEWRMPRALAALAFGAALGASGAVFQSLTRNPLASPDIIGFSAGAYSGALLVIIVISGNYLQVAAGALVGGLLTAALVYLLAFKRGVQGFRLIIVGIAVSATLSSINTWLLLTTDLDTAMMAAVWGAGSLNGTTWTQAGVGSLLALGLLLVILLLAHTLRQLEMGDDAASALGIRVEPVRLLMMLLSVGLVAVVTAAAGPISFVALAAPQIARRVAATAGNSVVPSALMGAVLLAASDYVAQHALPMMLPVGTVTVVIGGGYMIWLLVREARKNN